jgi:hypothetical protein
MESSYNRKTTSLTIGALLIAAGILIFAGQFFSWLNWNGMWPFIIIGAGAAFFAGMFLAGKTAGGLAVPGSILTTIGLILLVQNITGWWETWSYAWALIVASVGLGIFINGVYGGLPNRQESGRKLMRTGLVLFLAFGILFEFFFSLINVSDSGKIILSFALFAFGVYLLIYRAIGILRNPEKQTNKNLFWPVIMMASGLVILLVAMGWLPFLQLVSLLNLWPVLLIAIGLQLIVRNFSPWFGAGLGLLFLVAVLILVFFGPQLGLAQTPAWFIIQH